MSEFRTQLFRDMVFRNTHNWTADFCKLARNHTIFVTAFIIRTDNFLLGIVGCQQHEQHAFDAESFEPDMSAVWSGGSTRCDLDSHAAVDHYRRIYAESVECILRIIVLKVG